MIKDKKGRTEEEFLKTYSINNYEVSPAVTVDNLIFTITEEENEDIRKLNHKYLEVLLIKRDEHPFMNQYSLPGSFVKTDETLEETALRSLRDKTKLEDIYLEQLYTFDTLDRDPRTRVLSVSYMGLVEFESIKIKKERVNVKWFRVKTKSIDDHRSRLVLKSEDESIEAIYEHHFDTVSIVDGDSLAFDHLKIIAYGLNRLRNKLEYTDIAFSLLKDKFTMAELQQVYEVILDETLTKANFQRKIKDKVFELDEYRTGGYRPAKLFTYKLK